MGGKCSHSRESGDSDMAPGAACVLEAAVAPKAQDGTGSEHTAPSAPSPTNTVSTMPHIVPPVATNSEGHGSQVTTVTNPHNQFDSLTLAWKMGNKQVEERSEAYPTTGGLKYQLGGPVTGRRQDKLSANTLRQAQEALGPEARVNGVLTDRIDMILSGDISLSP